MKLSSLVIVILVFFLNHRSLIADDHNPAISAEITVYLYIIKVEATIKTCGRFDPENTSLYGKVYAKYHDEISGIVTRIGFLVGQDARSKGIDKETLLDSMEHRVNIVTQEVERTAERDSTGFINLCHNMPKAAADKSGPFKPLVQRFPQEMNIIQRPEDMEKLP